MSETLFKFLLSEVRAVRITCRREFSGAPCGGTVEVPVARLHRVKTCPVCGEDFLKDSAARLFADLRHAVENVAGLGAGEPGVELVLPGGPTAAPPAAAPPP